MSLDLHTLLVKITIIVSVLFFITGTSYAQTSTSTTGKFTNLQKGDMAPYTGTLFDPVAVAKILADKKFSKKSCDIKVQYEKNIIQAKCTRTRDLLSSELKIEKEKCNLIVQAQREEIETLRNLAKGVDNTLWATIGFALGAVTSVAIFFAAVKVSN
jgi:hypothetical protein